MSIFINKELRDLIPPLSEEEYQQLEENIVAEGIRDPLVVWRQPDGNDMLIDGHNRFFISTHHAGIPFKTVNMDFADMGEAKLWIIRNQLGRRNIDKWVRYDLAKQLEEIEAKQAKERQGTRSDIVPTLAQGEAGRTRDKLAAIVGVSHGTFDKMKAIDNSGDKELIRQVRDGETTINRAYMTVKGIEPHDKSMRQMKQEQLKQARQEHADFQQQKVVDFSDIAKDKENRKRIAKSLYSELLGIGKRIEEVSIRNKEKDIDIKGMSAILTHEERKLLLDMIGIWRTQLTQIAQEVTGN